MIALALLFLVQPAAAQLASPATELPKVSGVSDSQARQWTRGGDRLFFLTGPLSAGVLWTTDGTAAGTAAVLNGVDEILAASEGQLWVIRGPELWWSNGRADSGAQSKLLSTGAEYHGRFPNDGPLLFSRSSGVDRELLRVTDDAVQQIAEISPSVVAFTEERAFLFDRNDLWTTTPFEDGVHLVATAEDIVTDLFTTERYAYWLLDRFDALTEIWRSDGATAEQVALLPDRHPRVDVAARGDSMFWRAEEPASSEGLVANLWQFRDEAAKPVQRTFFQPTISTANQEGEEGVASLDAFERSSDGVFFMQQLGEQRRYVFLADGSASVVPIYEPCESCDDPAPVVSEEHGLLFTERPLGPDHLWHTVGTSQSTRVLFTCRVHPCGVLVEGLGFVTSNWDEQPPSLTVVDPVTGATRGGLAGGAPYDAFDPEGGLVPPSTFVTSLLLGTGSQPSAIDLETGEATPLGDFVDGRERTPSVVPSRREDLTYSARGIDGRGVGRVGATADSSFFYPREPFTLFELGSPQVALENVVLAVDRDGVVAWELENPVPRTVIWPNRASETTWLPISANRAIFQFPDFGNNTDEIVATDGTAEGTETLLTESATLSLVEAGDANLAYVVKSISFDLLGIFQTDGTPEGTSILVDLSADPVRLATRREQTLTANWIYFEPEAEGQLLRVHRTTGAVQYVDVPGEQLLARLPADDRLELVVFRDDRRDWLRLDDSAQSPSFVATLPEEPFEYLSGARHAELEGATVLFLEESIRWFTADGLYSRRKLSIRGGHVVSADRKQVFFGVETLDQGWEPWRIQVDDLEPRLLQDLRPGPASSEPAQWTRVADGIYFTANDGLLGPQIWRIDSRSAGCVPSEDSLCLNHEQFQIDVVISDAQGAPRRAPSRPITEDTGSFWFFEPSNLELMVKVLDGRAINDYFWTFFGSLTDVEFFLTVTDSATGLARRYGNSPGNFASLGDTRSIADGGPDGPALVDVPLAAARPALVAAAEPGPCGAGPENLCLQDGRFEVSATWTDFEGNTGVGRSRTLEEDTGAFWFFAEENLELMVKVLDARVINDHYWVYYGALSNVGFELHVRDTESGEVRVYVNTLGEFASAGDVTAFPADL